MKITGNYWKCEEDQLWVIEIPFLDIMTQAESRDEVPEMAKDAIESLVNDSAFNVQVTFISEMLLIEPNNPKQLVSLMLRRQRQRKRLKLEEVASHLQAKSLNEYAQYEQGKHMPSLEKLEQLLEAIDPQLSPYLCFTRES